MEFLTFAILVVITILFVVCWTHIRDRDSIGAPPEPPGHFLLGFIPFMKPRSYIAFANLKKKYADVVTVRMGMKKFAVLLSYDAVKEAFVDKGDNFATRPKSKFLMKILRNSGILHNDGPMWMEHRRFSIKTLRDFGMGKNVIQTVIHDEAERLVKRLQKRGEEPRNPSDDLVLAVTSVICKITFGERPAADDTRYNSVVSLLRKMLKLPIHKNVPVIFPFFSYIMPLAKFIPGVRHILQSMDDGYSYIQSKVDQHRSTLDTQNEPRDFTDAYLKEQAVRTASEQQHTFTDWQLATVIFELVIAATDTTANSLSWLLLLLALHPDVQEQMHSEIAQVVGLSRMPYMKDKLSMPYTQAVLDEVQRFGSVTPNSNFHRNIHEDTIRGYKIPAGTTIIPCLYAVHHDPDVWPEPDKFRPERFLSPDGEKYVPKEELIPFSMGPRACLGQSLAKMEYFLFSVVLLQRFKVTVIKESDEKMAEILLGSDGAMRSPEGHCLILQHRS